MIQRLLRVLTIASPAFAIGLALGMYAIYEVDAKKTATLYWGGFEDKMRDRFVLQALVENRPSCARLLLQEQLQAAIDFAPKVLGPDFTDEENEMLRASSVEAAQVLRSAAQMPKASCEK